MNGRGTVNDWPKTRRDVSSVEQKHTLQSFGCQKIKLFATFKYVTTQTIRAEKIYSHASLSTFSMFVFIGLLAIIIITVPTKKNKYFFCFLRLQNVNNAIEFYSFGLVFCKINSKVNGVQHYTYNWQHIILRRRVMHCTRSIAHTLYLIYYLYLIPRCYWLYIIF